MIDGVGGSGRTPEDVETGNVNPKLGLPTEREARFGFEPEE